jgi:hypothetical protein
MSGCFRPNGKGKTCREGIRMKIKAIFAVSFLISAPLSYLGLNQGYSFEYLVEV